MIHIPYCQYCGSAYQSAAVKCKQCGAPRTAIVSNQPPDLKRLVEAFRAVARFVPLDPGHGIDCYQRPKEGGVKCRT